MAKKRTVKRKGKRPKSKSKHKNVNIWKLYKIENNKLVRLNDFCPKCGAGTFMGKRNTQYFCGKCGYTVVKS